MDNGYTEGDISTLNELLKLGLGVDDIINMDKPAFEMHRGRQFKTIKEDVKYFKVDYDKDTKSEKFTEVSEKQYKEEEERLKVKKKAEDESTGISTYAVQVPYGGTTQETSGWMRLRTIASDAGKNSYGGQEIRFQTDFQWLSKPYFTAIDVVGTTWNMGYSVKPNSYYVQYTATRASSWYPTRTDKYYSYSVSNDGALANGIAFEINLYTDRTSGQYSETVTYSNHKGFMYLYVEVAPMSFTGLTNVWGRYSHEESTYEISPSINIPANGGSLGITSSKTYDHALPALLPVRITP